MSPFLRMVFLVVFLVSISPFAVWADEETDIVDPGSRSVAIWDFENGTVPGMGDIANTEYLVRTVPEMIIAKLVDVPDLKIVERVHLREAMEELKLGSSDLADPKSRLRLGKLSGAKFMVFGDFMVMGPVIQVTVRLVDVETSLMIFVDDQNGPLDTIATLIDSLSSNVARSFANGDLSVTQFAWKQDLGVWKRQDEGVILINERKYHEALQVFEGILKDHPNFRPAKRQIQMAKMGDSYRNGLEFMTAGKYREAVKVFKEVLKQNPSFRPARQNLKKALKLKRQAS